VEGKFGALLPITGVRLVGRTCAFLGKCHSVVANPDGSEKLSLGWTNGIELGNAACLAGTRLGRTGDRGGNLAALEKKPGEGAEGLATGLAAGLPSTLLEALGLPWTPAGSLILLA